jgi:hypothetical protein
MYSRLSFENAVRSAQILGWSRRAVSLKAGRQILCGDQVWKQHLHGFNAVGDDVANLVDLAHTSGAQFLKYLVVADALGGFVAHV